MIPASRQRNYLQSGLYVAIAAIVAAILLERLLTYGEAVEKAAMEETLARLNSALYVRVAYLVLRGERDALEALPAQSPFTVTQAAGGNYLGEHDRVPTEAIGSGRWLFDRKRSELVYLPNRQRHLEAPRADSGARELRFRMELVRAGSATVTGVSLKPVTKFRWEPLP